jgi:hypothetical protein
MPSEMSGHDGQIETIDGYREYLQRVTVIQGEAIKRLSGDPAIPPLEMAAMLEDIANLYLDVSDGIRELVLASPAEWSPSR